MPDLLTVTLGKEVVSAKCNYSLALYMHHLQMMYLCMFPSTKLALAVVKWQPELRGPTVNYRIGCGEEYYTDIPNGDA